MSGLSYCLNPGLNIRFQWFLWTSILHWSSTHSKDLYRGYWDTFWLWRRQYSWPVAAVAHDPTGGAFLPREGSKLYPVAKDWSYRRWAACAHVEMGFFRARYLWKPVCFPDADHVSEAVQLVAMVPGDVVKIVHVGHLNLGRRLRFHCTAKRSSDLISWEEVTNTEISKAVMSPASLTHIAQGPAGRLAAAYPRSIFIQHLCSTHGGDGGNFLKHSREHHAPGLWGFDLTRVVNLHVFIAIQKSVNDPSVTSKFKWFCIPQKPKFTIYFDYCVHLVPAADMKEDRLRLHGASTRTVQRNVVVRWTGDFARAHNWK